MADEILLNRGPVTYGLCHVRLGGASWRSLQILRRRSHRQRFLGSGSGRDRPEAVKDLWAADAAQALSANTPAQDRSELERLWRQLCRPALQDTLDSGSLNVFSMGLPRGGLRDETFPFHA